MNYLIQVSIIIFAVLCCDIVKCKPRYQVKNIQKRVHFELSPLPFKHIVFILDKTTPFGKYEPKHVIHKRQIAQPEITPVSNEVQVNDVVVIEDIPKLPEKEILVKKEEQLKSEVIITSIIKPVENGKSFGFMLPVESEVLITPAENADGIIKEKDSDIIKEISEVSIIPAPIQKPEEVLSPPEQVVEITPKVVEIPPPIPPVHQPVVENVVISTPVESTVQPLVQVPLFQNPNGPITSPVVNKIPNPPLLYTDISRIPINSLPTPVAIPIPEVIVPLPPPPPPVIEPAVVKEPPVVKEETPNFFVKGSRFVLYFGSMMLQMLTQLVNGRINLNQPLPAILPGMQ